MPSFVAFFPDSGGSELFSQRPAYGGDVQEGRVERSVGAGYVGHPSGVLA
jgi:hypothetical protein